MSQNPVILPTTGTVSGLQMTQNVNDALDTLNTLCSGAAAPASPEAGQFWHDTANNILKMRSMDNTAWIAVFNLDEANYKASPSYVASQPYNTASAAAANMAAVQGSQVGGFVNKFRNPSFDIAQRGASGTVASGSANYTLDGWIAGGSGASLSWAVANVFQFGAYSSLKLTGNTGMTDSFLRQRIESCIAAQLLALPSGTPNVTVQFLITNTTGATLTPTLTVRHAASVDNWSSPVIDVNAVPLQSVTNNNTGMLAYSFTPAGGIALGLEITLDFGAALNANTKSVQVIYADIRATNGVSTGLNNAPPQAEFRPCFTELAFCQRYYESSYDVGIAAGSVLAGGQETMIASTATGNFNVRYKVTKRIDPTVTVYSPGTGASGKVYDNNSASDISVASTPGLGQGGFNIQFSSTAAHQYLAHWAASAEL